MQEVDLQIMKKQNSIKEKNQQKLDQLEKQAKPLCLTKIFVDKPAIVIGVTSVIFVICTLLTMTQGLFDMSEGGSREWLVWSDEKVQARDLWNEAEKTFKKMSDNENTPVRSEEMDDWSTMIMIECYQNCDNILTSKYVNRLLEAEKRIKALSDYKNFCLATVTDSECSEDSLTSISNLLTTEQKSDGFSISELSQVMDQVLNDDDNYDSYSYLFGESFSSSNKKAKYLRTFFKFGSPLSINGKTYKNRYDDEDAQNDEFKAFTEDIIDIIDDINDENGDNDVLLLIFSEVSSGILMDKYVNNDFLWSLASIIFVWGYLTFHLQSFFLSCFSMLNILFSFPVSLVIMRLIFGVSYFSSLHILVIFIILGIAADNVFVFQDAWKQTEQYSILANDYNKRMAVTFKRAAKAILATSSTTSAAFLATGFSSIMPISSFGIFAGILVPINYILVITFYPAILVVHQRHINNKCCCGYKSTKDQKENTQEETKKENVPQSDQSLKDLDSQRPTDNKEYHKELSRIERFFANQFNTFIYKAKYLIIVAFLAWTGVASWRASKLGPLTEPEKFLPDDNEVQRVISHAQSSFIQSGESDYVIEVTLLLGLDKMDTSETTAWDIDNAGVAVFDKNFDLSIERNQQYLYDFCISLQDYNMVLDRTINCFMLDFQQFVNNNGYTFPVAENDFLTKIEEFTSDPLGQPYYMDNLIGLYNNKLNYVAIIATSIGEAVAGYEEQEPIEEKWQKYVQTYNKSAPSGINNMKQSSDTWTWMVSQKAFVDQAFSGMFISLAFALAVLVLSTHNIVVSLYSIFSIIGIIVSVVTVMELSGWQMGVAESITIVILIGFSVDYVVHLATHYVESSYDDRYTRMQESLQDIGISIISGAITTLGSGVFLFLAVLVLFNKFALLIVSTICFSLLFSLFFFSSMMHAFGPQKDFGNILALFKKKNVQRDNRVSSEKQLSTGQKEVIEEAESDI